MGEKLRQIEVTLEQSLAMNRVITKFIESESSYGVQEGIGVLTLERREFIYREFGC